ncbi:hypothetical protein BJV77DRAFT_1067089 [Russula vinacea]|nr:hypothetical protein BJV77DRAFT_1067089 [Russula vinacea]
MAKRAPRSSDSKLVTSLYGSSIALRYGLLNKQGRISKFQLALYDEGREDDAFTPQAPTTSRRLPSSNQQSCTLPATPSPEGSPPAGEWNPPDSTVLRFLRGDNLKAVRIARSQVRKGPTRILLLLT